jgi:hypothetical protein
MSDEPLPIEFVGGPMDGRTLWVEPGTETTKAGSLDMEGGRVIVVDHVYKIRRVNGILVRLPNGFHAMDYQGVPKRTDV